MKKITFLFLAFIFSACASPQVTVTSAPKTSEVSKTSEVLTPTPPIEAPIPSPTFHPEFISLQEKIADSGARFTLQADGMIQDGAEIIPGLTVAPDGTLTLTTNGKTVTLDSDSVSFGEDGIEIEGYELDDNGVWVEAISPAEAQFNADMEKWGIDLDGEDKDKFETGTDADGKITLTEKESGKVIYIDGSWEPEHLGKMIKESGSCKIMPWTGSKIGQAAPSDGSEFEDKYLDPLDEYYVAMKQNGQLRRGGGLMAMFYNMGDGCWGIIRFAKYDQKDAIYFWKNKVGKPMYEYVFMSSSQK